MEPIGTIGTIVTVVSMILCPIIAHKKEEAHSAGSSADFSSAASESSLFLASAIRNEQDKSSPVNQSKNPLQ